MEADPEDSDEKDPGLPGIIRIKDDSKLFNKRKRMFNDNSRTSNGHHNESRSKSLASKKNNSDSSGQKLSNLFLETYDSLDNCCQAYLKRELKLLLGKFLIGEGCPTHVNE